MSALNTILRRRSPAGAPPPSSGTFKVAANVGGLVDYGTGEPLFVDLIPACRGFGTVGDPLRNTAARPALNAVDRYPSEDFGLVIPIVPYSAAAQVLHCKLGGIATLGIDTAFGRTLANQAVVGDDTTFDINIAAGAVAINAVMTFTNTKRTAASATGTGCRSLVIKSAGYSLADATQFMPGPVAALRRFSCLRMMDLSLINNDLTSIAASDRASDGKRAARGPYMVSVEDACRLCNAVGTGLWWNIPSAASDALITAMAAAVDATLSPGQSAKFELGNENWNAAFAQMVYWLDLAMATVNGFSAQYHASVSAVSAARAANVLTINFALPHGLSAGDRVLTYGIGTDGLKAVGVPTATSITVPDAGADGVVVPVSPNAVVSGRVLLSAMRAANVVTVETGIDHAVAAGASVGINGIGGLAGMKVVKAAPTPRTLTFDDVGSDGVVALSGASSLVGAFTNALCSDGVYDQFNLARRMYAKRTCEMSTLIKAVFGATFGTRAKVGLFNQPGNSQADQVGYIARALGAPSTFLHAIGHATYFFLDATAFGGPNLRNVATYNGNTPPSHADYLAALALTADGAKTSLKDNYDANAITAATYGLKLWQYEFGPDVTGYPVGTAGAAAGLSKIDTLFDPLFKPSYRKLLDNLEQHGFEEVALYAAGCSPAGSNSEYSGWGIWRDYGTPSVRSDAIDECMAAPRTGPTRNLLNGASGATTAIDPRGYVGHYDLTGIYPGATDWLITSPVAGVFSFQPTFVNNSAQATELRLRVNGALVGATYPIPNTGTQSPAARPITLRVGINAVSLERDVLYVGALAQVQSLSFTAP